MNESVEQDRKTQLRAVLSFLLILSIIAITALGLVMLVLNKRKAKEEVKERIIPTVEVTELSKKDYRVIITTQGVVESSRETRLAAEVSGRVMEISPNLKRAGMVSKGERLVKIDASDYRATLAGAEVTLADAEVALEQERAKVQQAKLDWEKLGSGTPVNPLVLREPYLKAAEARVAAAREEAARAQKNLERTEIVSPFDAGVRTAEVEEGAVVTVGGAVATLYASTELEVRLPMSLLDFGFLDRDADGNVIGKVLLKGKIGADTHEWEAMPIRVDPEIDRKTLSASVVVKVMKAEEGKFPFPPVGLFVDAELDGKVLPDVVEIPRRGLLEGGRVIVVKDDGGIAFRDVSVIRLTGKSAVVGSGLENGDRMVLTRLSAAVDGMEVVIEEPVETEEEK